MNAPVKSPVKACVGCKHIVLAAIYTDPKDVETFAMCGLTQAINPVSGRAELRHCSTERAGFCGPEGMLWEPPT